MPYTPPPPLRIPPRPPLIIRLVPCIASGLVAPTIILMAWAWFGLVFWMVF